VCQQATKLPQHTKAKLKEELDGLAEKLKSANAEAAQNTAKLAKAQETWETQQHKLQAQLNRATAMLTKKDQC
jgi:hypothetical protein